MSENEQASGYDQIQFTSKKYKTISFLSDLGTEDESVAACRAVMRQQCEDVTIVDITHEVPPFDIRFAALVLTRAIQFLNEGVIVAYVDPGAPKDQRYIAVELDAGVLIGPDNGILAPAVRVIGQPKRVHAISNEEFRYDTPSHTFAARDVLAPAAGLIANGMDISELGEEIPLSELVPVLLEAASFDKGGAINAEVWSLDRFGNIEINITPEDLDLVNADFGDNIVLRINNEDYVAKYVETFADLGVSELGILTDSSGLLSIVKNLDDAGKALGLKAGKSLVLLAPNTEVTGELDENVQYPVEEEPLSEPHIDSNPANTQLNQQFPSSQAPQVPFSQSVETQQPISNQQEVQPNEFVDYPQNQDPATQQAPGQYTSQPRPPSQKAAPVAPTQNPNQFNEFQEPQPQAPQSYSAPAQPSPSPQQPMGEQDNLQPYVPQEIDEEVQLPVEEDIQQPQQQDPYSGVIPPSVENDQPNVDPQYPANLAGQAPTESQYAQQSTDGNVDPNQSQPNAVLPENVFDLFKEDTDEEDPTNP